MVLADPPWVAWPLLHSTDKAARKTTRCRNGRDTLLRASDSQPYDIVT
jgi:hypothetical protein